MKTLYQKKMIYIGILVTIMVVITVGFAAFSKTLNIKTFTSINTNPNNFNFTVSGSKTELDLLEVEPHSIIGKNVTANTANIHQNNNTFLISNIKPTFNKNTGGYVDYIFYVHNTGKMNAYLKKESLSDYSIRCTPREGTTDNLVQQACEKLYVNVYYSYPSAYYFLFINELTSKIRIAPETFLSIEVRVGIDESSQNSAFADGPFDVEVDDIELTLFSN